MPLNRLLEPFLRERPHLRPRENDLSQEHQFPILDPVRKRLNDARQVNSVPPERRSEMQRSQRGREGVEVRWDRVVRVENGVGEGWEEGEEG